MEGQQIRSIPVTTLAFTNSDSHHHYRTPGMTATISADVSFFFCLMIRASGCCFFTVVFRGQKGWSYEGVWVRKVVMFAFIHVGSCLSFKNVRECRCILKCWRQIFLDVYLQVGLEGGGVEWGGEWGLLKGFILIGTKKMWRQSVSYSVYLAFLAQIK